MLITPELFDGVEGSCGHLITLYSFRGDRRSGWEEGEEVFPATEVDFSASGSLSCGHHPERPGSIKWFRYRMAGTAVVKSIGEPSDWQNVPLAHQGDMDHFLAKYLKGLATYGRDTARTNTRALFRYRPPEEQYLEKLYEMALEGVRFGEA